MTRLLNKNPFKSLFEGEEEEIIEMLKIFKYDRYQEFIAAVNFTFCLPLSIVSVLADLHLHKNPQVLMPGWIPMLGSINVNSKRAFLIYTVPLHVFKQEDISLTIMCDLGLNKPYPQL